MHIRNAIFLLVSILLPLMFASGCAVVRTAAVDDQRSADSIRGGGPRVLELRVHGAGGEGEPPLLRPATTIGTSRGAGSEQLVIEFELNSDQYPNLGLRLVHCDRFWKRTDNVFIQDPARLQTYDFDIRRAPIGVRSYDYECSITFPRSGSRIRVEHSGNYLAQIFDADQNDVVLGEGRFFAVEGNCSVDIGIVSDFYESPQTETPQHGVKVRVEAEPSFDIFGSQIKGIALMQSGMWYSQLFAGDGAAEDGIAMGRPWIRWYPSFAGKVVAEFRNLPAGNEHRILDLTDVTVYPTIAAPISTPLSDLPRRSFTMLDNNGIAISRILPSGDEDYVTFEFRLDLLGREVQEQIYVVGTFSRWKVEPQWRMMFDSVSKFYTAQGHVRRAVHEYEYVAGQVDPETGEIQDLDATLIEGNLRQTQHVYYALVYYQETSAGGYDRIVGVGASITGSQ